MVKKFLESKNAELLLASQVIDSSESARMKRSSQRPLKTEKEASLNRKTSQKLHKLDAAKLAVKQQEKHRRLVRKKLRRSESSVINPKKSAPAIEERASNASANAASPGAQLTRDKRARRVSFA